MADVLSEAIVRIKSTFDNSGMKEANSALSNFTTKAKQLGGLFGGAFALHGITNLIEQSVKFGSTLADTSQRLGISSETIQEYGFVAEQAGISTETFAKGISFLNANIGEAQSGNKSAIESFQKMGISLKDANGQFKTLEQVLDEVPDGLNRLKTDSQKVAVAGKLFGKSGKESALILAQGSKEIRAQISALRQYGGVLSNESARGLDEVDDRLLLVNKGWEVFKAELTFGFKDAILNAFGYVKKFTDGFKELERRFGILRPILIAIGLGIAAAMAPAARAALPVVAQFAGLALIVDDLIALFSGGKSVIGAFLATLLGYDNAKTLIVGIKGAAKTFIDFMKVEGIPIAQGFLSAIALPFRIFFDLLQNGFTLMKAVVKLGTGDFKGAVSAFKDLNFSSTRTGLQNIAKSITNIAQPGLNQDLSIKQFAFGGGITQEQATSALSGGVGPTINNARSQNNNVTTTINVQTNNPAEMQTMLDEYFGNKLANAMASTTQEVE